jgi:excisionase family DNA binding protein
MAQLRESLVWLLNQREPGKAGMITWSSVEIAALGQTSEHRAKMWLAMLEKSEVVQLVRVDKDGTKWYRGSSNDTVRKWKSGGSQAHAGGNSAEYVRGRKIRDAIEARILGKGPGVERAMVPGAPVAVTIVHRVECAEDLGLHNVKTVARILNVTQRTIYSWIAIGKIQATRPSERTIRIHSTELRKLLAPTSPIDHVRQIHALSGMMKDVVHAS